MYLSKPFQNQSMASGQPLEIVQRLMPHPVLLKVVFSRQKRLQTPLFSNKLNFFFLKFKFWFFFARQLRMTIIDCSISLKMIKKILVVFGVVDMRQFLLNKLFFLPMKTWKSALQRLLIISIFFQHCQLKSQFLFLKNFSPCNLSTHRKSCNF